MMTKKQYREYSNRIRLTSKEYHALMTSKTPEEIEREVREMKAYEAHQEKIGKVWGLIAGAILLLVFILGMFYVGPDKFF